MKMIFVVMSCQYIIIIDCSSFFYQWRVHSTDKHKFIVVSHRDQKFFNVAVMSYKNNSIYVQKQMNRLLKSYSFARIYVDDIVIFFKTLEKHIRHLRQIFDMLIANNIFIKSEKIFIEYLSVQLLNQKIDSFELTTFENKLKTIIKLFYSTIL